MRNVRACRGHSDKQFPDSYLNMGLLACNVIMQGVGRISLAVLGQLRAVAVVTCSDRQNTEEVITTAGGGCYVSREERPEKHDVGRQPLLLFAGVVLSAA